MCTVIIFVLGYRYLADVPNVEAIVKIAICNMLRRKDVRSTRSHLSEGLSAHCNCLFFAFVTGLYM